MPNARENDQPCSGDGGDQRAGNIQGGARVVGSMHHERGDIDLGQQIANVGLGQRRRHGPKPRRAHARDRRRKVRERLGWRRWLLIGGGVVGLLHAAGVVSVSVPVFLAAALIFTGVALLVSAWTGGTGGLIAVAVVLTVALAVATVVRTPFTGGWGDQRWVPSSLAEVRSSYRHGGGHLVIDLSRVTFPTEGQSVHARLGVGDLKVILPMRGRVAVDAHAGVGDLRLVGHHQDGLDVDDSAVSGNGDEGSLRLRIDVGAGQVEVVRAEDVYPPPFQPTVPNPPTPQSPPTTSELR